MIIKNVSFCKKMIYYPNVIRKHNVLKYVKKHLDIFASKIIRRTYNYENYIVVSEHSYYDDNFKYWWIWFFHREKGLFIVINPNKRLKDIIDIMTKNDFEISNLKNYEKN